MVAEPTDTQSTPYGFPVSSRASTAYLSVLYSVLHGGTSCASLYGLSFSLVENPQEAWKQVQVQLLPHAINRALPAAGYKCSAAPTKNPLHSAYALAAICMDHRNSQEFLPCWAVSQKFRGMSSQFASWWKTCILEGNEWRSRKKPLSLYLSGSRYQEARAAQGMKVLM